MPSGKAHDVVTVLLTVPVFGIGFLATRDAWLASIAAAGFLFGGFMFGPDLDTVSKQYSRWLIFRHLWFPYRKFFKHRSRWSHGLLFGTLLRVVYAMGVLTCVAFILTYGYTAYIGGEMPGVWEFASVWRKLREYSDILLGAYGTVSLFLGMWIGAVSHSLTDVAGTYVKTGRL